jgi:hypothetical protein
LSSKEGFAPPGHRDQEQRGELRNRDGDTGITGPLKCVWARAEDVFKENIPEI